MGFKLFLVHPTMVSVLLSASVETCFVSHMQDFCKALSLSYHLGYHKFFHFTRLCLNELQKDYCVKTKVIALY